MLEKFNGNKFTYKKLSLEEQKQRGILGRLVGVIADFKNPTRNGRGYSEELWDNVFNNPIMKEKIENHCLLGELGHPADRAEIDIEKAAICMAELPKKGSDGKIYGVFDILSTPNGRILKALCDYGCNIAISSRGQGDLITDDNGNEAVDPDTYECETWDAVLVPGVEAARLQYVNESLNVKKNKKTLRAVLQESLTNADEDGRKVMEETLNNLGIDLEEEAEKDTEQVIEDEKTDTEEVVEINDDDSETIEAEEVENKEEESQEETEDTEEDTVEINSDEEESAAEVEPEKKVQAEEVPTTTDPQEIFLDFLANNFDEDKIKKVCKILDIEVIEDEEDADESTEEVEDKQDSETEESVDDIKKDSDKEESDQVEEPVEEAINNGDDALVNNLKEALKIRSDLENEVKSLQEKLAVSDSKVNEAHEECNKYKNAVIRLSTLAKSTKDLKENVSRLEESLSQKEEIIANQNTRISKLVESRKVASDLNESLNNKAAEINSLNENLASVKKESEEKINALNESFKNKERELNESLAKATSLKESYRKLANKTVNKYIEVKANILGVNPKDITRKLGKTYTLEDVDQVCEDLKRYQLNVSKLPFSLDKKVSVRVNEGVSTAPINKSKAVSDDDVDDSLIRLANCDF